MKFWLTQTLLPIYTNSKERTHVFNLEKETESPTPPPSELQSTDLHRKRDRQRERWHRRKGYQAWVEHRWKDPFVTTDRGKKERIRKKRRGVVVVRKEKSREVTPIPKFPIGVTRVRYPFLCSRWASGSSFPNKTECMKMRWQLWKGKGTADTNPGHYPVTRLFS